MTANVKKILLNFKKSSMYNTICIYTFIDNLTLKERRKHINIQLNCPKF